MKAGRRKWEISPVQLIQGLFNTLRARQALLFSQKTVCQMVPSSSSGSLSISMFNLKPFVLSLDVNAKYEQFPKQLMDLTPQGHPVCCTELLWCFLSILMVQCQPGSPGSSAEFACVIPSCPARGWEGHQERLRALV